MMRVILYTKRDCQLCEEARAKLDALKDEFPHELVMIDIEVDPALMDHFGEKVPVIEIGPYMLCTKIDETDLRITLGAAKNRYYKEKPLSGKKRSHTIAMMRLVLFIIRHWLLLFNLFVALYLALPFAAPILMNQGLTGPAGLIYKLYRPLCNQLAYRSWFLFGEQPAYPIEAAGTSFNSYEEMIGMSPADLFSASQYVGNEKVGYKVALCERCVAIYAGLLFAGLLFAILRKRLKPISIFTWILLGIVPIALDGISQLAGAIPFLPFPSRESTPLIRTVVGILFGVMNVWLAYPYMEESMREARVSITAKLVRVDQQQSMDARSDV
jgi:uncharacterized membrane protein/glutaredoxin